MKLHTEIITLCDYALIAREGKLSINGIFDELRVQKFPGGISRAFFVATLQGKPETSYKLKINTEIKGKVINSLNLEMHTSLNGKNNIILELVNLGFEKEGEYKFIIYHDKDEVGSTLLKVLSAEQQNQEVKYKLPN
ncbi:MAG TPA: hypothetical protein VNW29_07415 [Candidatus Sulfotelmatobacter sp.]|jgi:hypothetical protein|nr:hypothetical protein [Candidatus Sulfotelmatobacter sp.]